MTGTEYLYLSEGDQCILLEDLETCNLKWNKGDIIEVVYRNTFEETIYFKNITAEYTYRPSYKALNVMWCLKMMKLYKKFNDKSMTITTFKHKFNVGDTVWLMEHNKPVPYKIVKLEYSEEKDSTDYCYICDSGKKLNDTCEIYESKDALLDSLR